MTWAVRILPPHNVMYALTEAALGVCDQTTDWLSNETNSWGFSASVLKQCRASLLAIIYSKFQQQH